MGLEDITHEVGDVHIDEADRSLQEIIYQRALAKQNARIVLVGMQKLAEEIREGKHPRISPDKQRAYKIALGQLKQLRVPEHKLKKYLTALTRLRQDYSEIIRYLRPG